TFTAWINSFLRKADTSIEDITQDLCSGLKLMLLLEVISSEALPKPERGRMRFHKINNVNKALEFIERKGVQLVSIGAEDTSVLAPWRDLVPLEGSRHLISWLKTGISEIVDGKREDDAGMIWTIILRFAIQASPLKVSQNFTGCVNISAVLYFKTTPPNAEMTAKEGLLLWCQRKTAPYKNVNVQNFHMSINFRNPNALRPPVVRNSIRSWKDGLAFCALIHRHRPELLDYSKLSRPQNARRRCKNCRTTRWKNLNLASMWPRKHTGHSQDVRSRRPDERSRDDLRVRLTTTSLLGAPRRRRPPPTRICKVLRLLIKRTRRDPGGPQANRQHVDASRTASNPLFDGVRDPPQAVVRTIGRAEKAAIAGGERPCWRHTFNTLQTRPAPQQPGPAYLPHRGQAGLQKHRQRLEGLEKAEKGFEEWMLQENASELGHRMRLGSSWLKRQHDEAWMEGKEAQQQSQDFKSCFRGRPRRSPGAGEQICKIAEDLNSLGYHGPGLRELSLPGHLRSRWDRLGVLSTNQSSPVRCRRSRALREAEQVLESLDQLHLQFAKRAAPFNNWLDGANEDLMDFFIVYSVQEVDSLRGRASTRSSRASAAGCRGPSTAAIAHIDARWCASWPPPTAFPGDALNAVHRRLTARFEDFFAAKSSAFLCGSAAYSGWRRLRGFREILSQEAGQGRRRASVLQKTAVARSTAELALQTPSFKDSLFTLKPGVTEPPTAPIPLSAIQRCPHTPPTGAGDEVGRSLRSVPARDQSLQQEVARQHQNERLRRQFADLANRLDGVSSICSSGRQLSLEEQDRRLNAIQDELQGFKIRNSFIPESPENRAECSNPHPRPPCAEQHRRDGAGDQSIQEAFIFDNPHSPYTMETIRVAGSSCCTLAKALNEVANQILSRARSGLEINLHNFNASGFPTVAGTPRASTNDEMTEFAQVLQTTSTRAKTPASTPSSSRPCWCPRLQHPQRPQGEQDFRRASWRWWTPTAPGPGRLRRLRDFMTIEKTDQEHCGQDHTVLPHPGWRP
uniref:Calponin-homology (CH) domain-containing protein n=1 Tax=Macrostomum lignano TaxID=282301 RepID=A0A1I8FFC4_9PLAT